MRAADQRPRAARRPRAGADRDALARGVRRGARRKRSRSAPWPTWPRQIRPRAGAATTPATGVPFSISAILTVYSSRPARNSRVPSSGSTRRSAAPSASTARLPVRLLRHHRHARQQPRQPVEDDGLRGLVGGGDRRARPALSRWFRSGRGTARMAAAAREAISVRPSSSADRSRIPSSQCPCLTLALRFITSPAHARRPNRLNVPDVRHL